MKTALVGYTGFVGSNLAASHAFSALYNSKNIRDAFGTSPELLIFAGIRAEKYIANQEPEADREIVEKAFENIRKIQPKQLVLISTVDVYPAPVQVNEDSVIDDSGLLPYGRNRLLLERLVRNAYPDTLIVRLPGLFGQNIKKNFIYDLIRVIPSALTPEKFTELSQRSPMLSDFYALNNHGFLQCRPLTRQETERLKEEFFRIGFTALHFTDSRGQFQFYYLAHLWDHIQMALQHSIPLLNLATEPLTIAQIYQSILHEDFVNEIPGKTVPLYDFRTKYDSLFGGKGGYIYSKDTILQEIQKFVEEQR